MSSSPSHILESLPLEDHPSLFTMSLEPILAERFRIETRLHHVHVTLLSEQLFGLYYGGSILSCNYILLTELYDISSFLLS